MELEDEFEAFILKSHKMAALEGWAKRELRFEIQDAPNLYGISHGRLEIEGEFLDVSFVLLESYDVGIELLRILRQLKDIPEVILSYDVVRGQDGQHFLMVEKVNSPWNSILWFILRGFLK